jgi:hypothetical protein
MCLVLIRYINQIKRSRIYVSQNWRSSSTFGRPLGIDELLPWAYPRAAAQKHRTCAEWATLQQFEIKLPALSIHSDGPLNARTFSGVAWHNCLHTTGW